MMVHDSDEEAGSEPTEPREQPTAPAQPSGDGPADEAAGSAVASDSDACCCCGPSTEDKGEACGCEDAAETAQPAEPAAHEHRVAPAPEAKERPVQTAEASTAAAAAAANEASMSTEPDLPPPMSVPVPLPMRAPTVMPVPQIAEVTLAQAPVNGGTRVTLDGKNLYRESIVRFGGVLAKTIGATGDRQLRVEAPPQPKAGVVDLSVQNPGAVLTTLPKAFRYEELAAPKITSVAPARGAVAGRTEIAVTGKNFVRGAVVLFDGKEIEKVAFVDSSTLELRTPPGTAGKMVDVVVKNPDGKQDLARRAFLYDERYG